MQELAQVATISVSGRRPWYTILYVQVLIAIALGVAVGHLDPTLGVRLKPLGDAFIALGQELGIVAIAMLSSKDASGVTGAGFVTLAATLAIVPDIPIQSLALLVGIDKFMSECRALTNLIGNGVATIVISRWEGELDRHALHETMAHPIQVGEELENGPA
jgi:Na+/H+-dicarboxylate symporter